MIFRIATLVGLAATAGYVGMLVADREPPTVSAKLEVVTERVPRGGSLKVRFTVFRTRSCALRVERLVVDAQNERFILPATEFSAAPGPLGQDSYVTSIALPQEIAPGPAHYRTISVYRCNASHWLWPIVVLGGDVAFEVTLEESRR